MYYCQSSIYKEEADIQKYDINATKELYKCTMLCKRISAGFSTKLISMLDNLFRHPTAVSNSTCYLPICWAQFAS